MADGARIQSIDALGRLRSYLLKWADEVRTGVSNADADVRRTADWLEHQQPAHWSMQLAKRQRAFEEAKQELSKKLYGVTSRDNPPSTVYERKMLQRAKASVLEAEEKLKALKQWRVKYAKESQAYFGSTANARHLPDAVVPKAAAYLDALRDHLERYIAVQNAPPEPTMQIDAPSVARPLDAESGPETSPTPEASS